VRRAADGDREFCRHVAPGRRHLRLREEQDGAQIRTADVGVAQVGAEEV
jgi:hypothetical protein